MTYMIGTLTALFFAFVANEKWGNKLIKIYLTSFGLGLLMLLWNFTISPSAELYVYGSAAVVFPITHFAFYKAKELDNRDNNN